mgnify:FL=1
MPAGWPISHKGKFLVGYDDAGGSRFGAGLTAGGYVWHGKTENNHCNHCSAHCHGQCSHVHPENQTLSVQTIAVQAGAGTTVVCGVTISTTSSTGAANPTYTDIANGIASVAEHNGPCGTGGLDTDNCPPYIIIAWIVRTV